MPACNGLEAPQTVDDATDAKVERMADLLRVSRFDDHDMWSQLEDVAMASPKAFDRIIQVLSSREDALGELDDAYSAIPYSEEGNAYERMIEACIINSNLRSGTTWHLTGKDASAWKMNEAVS